MSDQAEPLPGAARRRDRVEIAATLLLAIAAVATAWSSYQATRWNGEQAKATSRTNAIRIQAARAASLSEAETQVDVATFIQWVDAHLAGDAEVENFYVERFRAEFKPAFESWVATNPFAIRYATHARMYSLVMLEVVVGLALVLRAKKEGVPLPGATAPGTPWSDMTKTGDTFFTNEMVDNILVSNDGWLGDAAKLYANGHDLKDPQLSPIYGDYAGFPPTILTSGTRDLFLSNTVRVHRKLRQAGVVADLHVFEGQSHGQYGGDPAAPETKEHFGELTKFFDKYLGK